MKDNIAVFFHYYEQDDSYRDNLIFFLSVAYHESLSFFVVISGTCSVHLPKLKNVRYIYTENINNDYGGYVRAIAQLRDSIDSFDFFIFVNSSVRGPFWDNRNLRCWVDVFCKKLQQDTHLVGSSINILSNNSGLKKLLQTKFDYSKPYSHVQTTAYALTKVAMKHLLEIGFYDVHERLSKDEVICSYELRLSQEIKKAGWNFKCCLEKYNHLDYRQAHSDINESSRNGDPLFRGAYFGRTVKPREVVFIKTNRNLLPTVKLNWITFVALITVDSELARWVEFSRLKWKYAGRVALSPLRVVSCVTRTVNSVFRGLCGD